MLTGALTALLLAALGALGTTGYAGNKDGNSSSAQYQYNAKVVICHRPAAKSRVASGVTLKVAAEGAKAHFRQHEGDTAGPCPDA